MDINKLFKLFEEDESHLEEENQRLVDIFKDHPLIKIGYFKKLIKNYSIYWNNIIKQFENNKIDIEIEDIKKAGEFILFSKAYEYISFIKISDPYHLECIKSLANKDFLDSLNFSIKHFEKLEEYEKCGFIKNIRDKVILI